MFMKKASFILFVISCLFLSFSVFSKVSVWDKGGTLYYDFEVEGVNYVPVSIDGRPFQRAQLLGIDGYQGIIYQLGKPEIPVIRFYVDARYDKDISISSRDEQGGWVKKRLDFLNLPPIQLSIPKIPGVKVDFSKDKIAYGTNDFLPKGLYTIEDAGSVDGRQRKLVTLYPLRYNPVTNESILRRNFRVEVSGFKSVVREDRNVEDSFVFIIGNQFKNSPSLIEYMEFKHGLGYKIEKIIIQTGDTSSIIRNKLKAIYSNDQHFLKYAMIIGDLKDVPSHKAGYISGVTDHYYRAIDTDNYSSDINGPDIGVGRITPKNEGELATTLAKFIKYQKGLFANEEWLNHVSFLATNDKWELAEATHNYVINTYMKKHGYVGVFPSANQAGGDQLYAVTHHVSNAKTVEVMGFGRTIVNYSGHGGKTLWADPRVTQSNVRAFTYEDALPFVISNACITGDFRTDESFGETWIKEKHGAIMFWGSMDSSYWDEDDILERRMYDGIYKDNLLAFNKITQRALSEHWKHYGGSGKSKYYWETYVTFGDPSILLRTTETKTVKIDGSPTVSFVVKEVSYTITGTDGNPVKGAKVSITLEENVVSGITDENGVVKLSLEFGEVGEVLDVTVYGDNLRIATKTLKIVSSDSTYLQLSNFKVNNRPEELVYPFEDVVLNFMIKNVSTVGMDAGKISIVGIEGPASTIDGDVVIPEIAGEAEYFYDGDKIKFRIGNGHHGDSVVVKLKWSVDGGESATIVQRFKVARVKLNVVQVDFGDPVNPGIGGFAPGEEGDVYLTLKNDGLETLSNGKLTGEVTNCFEDIKGELKIDELTPGVTVRLLTPLRAVLNSNCSVGDIAKFPVKGTYESFVTNIDIDAAASFLIGKIGMTEYFDGDLSVKIPDNSLIRHKFDLNNVVSIGEISVHVKIDHTYIGDISVTLIHPDGTRTLLRKPSGGSTDNLDKIFTSSDHVELKKLLKRSAVGAWKLEVKDHSRRDTGKLKYLKVSVTGVAGN